MKFPDLTRKEVLAAAKSHGIEAEADFQGWIVDFAQRVLHVTYIYHTHRSQHSAAGWPDLALLKDRGIDFVTTVAYLEVKGVTKRGPGTVSAEQQTVISSLRRVRGDTHAAIVWPWQRDELTAALREVFA